MLNDLEKKITQIIFLPTFSGNNSASIVFINSLIIIFKSNSYIYFGYNVKARMRANTQNVQGEQETKGVGEGRKKECGTET